MSQDFVIRQDTGAIASLTLTAPASLNALSEGMLAALQAEFDRLHGDTSIRAVILKGSGKVFCAGHDLKEMTAGRQAEDAGRAYFQQLFATCSKVMLSIRDLPQPVIAQVHGLATAAGCQLVATCDMAVAATGTRFGVNGINIGLFCSTPMVPLSRNIPAKLAFEMLTTGGFIDADKALQYGLVNRVTQPEDLQDETLALAQKVSEKLGGVVKIGKQAFYNQMQMPLDEAYDYTGDVMAQNMLFRDTEEGINAFIEKRAPNWQQP
jgi:enoyl-CoA hydratase/carnithine racemase